MTDPSQIAPLPFGTRNRAYRKHLCIGLALATIAHVAVFSLYQGGSQVVTRHARQAETIRIARYVDLEPPEMEGEEGGGGGSTMLLEAGPTRGDGAKPENVEPVPNAPERPVAERPGAKDSIPPDQIPPNAITDAGVNLPAGQGEGGFGPGSGGGYGGGSGGGIGSGTGRGTGSGEKPTAPKVSIRLPHPVRFVEPEYPREAHRRRVYAEVFILVTVSETGQVLSSHITRRVLLDRRGRPQKEVASIGYGIEQAALSAVSKWQFVPGRRNNEPFVSSTTVSIRFAGE